MITVVCAILIIFYLAVGVYCHHTTQKQILESDFDFELTARLLKRADMLIFTWPKLWVGF